MSALSLDYPTTSFPKNMSYHFDKIVNYSKQTVKVYCDRTGNIAHGESLIFELPKNTLIDLDSLLWSYNLTIPVFSTADGPQTRCRRLARNSASIIDAIYVYINDQQISADSYYNHLFNLMTDHTAGFDFHSSGVRQLENTDPSILQTYNNANGALANVRAGAIQVADNSDNGRQYIVRNWLSFLGTCATRVIDTSLFGTIKVEIRLAEPTILWASAATNGANPVVVNANPSYTINGTNSFMSITKIAFGDSVYYNLLRNIVMSSGLKIPYKTYTAHRGNAFTKAAGTFTHQFNVNSSHLTKLIGTTLIGAYQTDVGLILEDPGDGFLTQVAGQDATLFNQCAYFRKEATGLGSLNWDINNVSQYPAPISYTDVYNENLKALNMDNDVQAGCHPGMQSVYQFLRYYFVSILSFEHIQNTPEFVLEGLDGKAAQINCKLTLTFEDVGEARDLIPLVWSERQCVLNVNAGQQVFVDK